MRRIVMLLYPLVCIFVNCFAQLDISISVAIPSDCPLERPSRVILRDKLVQLLSADGVASDEFSTVAIVPSVSIIDSKTIDAGMRKIESVEMSVTASVMNIMTNVTFGTFQVTTFGEGYSKNDCLRSAISKLNLLQPQYKQAISQAHSKAKNYYETNVDALIFKAKSLSLQRKYDEALALLDFFPKNMTGYDKVYAAMEKIFREGQSTLCKQILIAAQSSYSNKDYDSASSIISTIDGESPCAEEAKKLLSSIKRDHDRREANEMELHREFLRSEERVKTAQLKTIESIAKAYLQNQAKYIFF